MPPVSFLAMLRERRFHHKQIKQIAILRKRARKRGLGSPRDLEELSRLHEALGAAVKAREYTRAREIGAEAEKLVSKKLAESQKASLMESFLSLFWAVMLALAIRTFIIEPFQIPTGSMIPSLQIGDHIFVNKLSYGFRLPLINLHLLKWSDPERGDIVIFPFPVEGPDHGKDYIKRIVGLPGDRIRLEGNGLIINGEPVEVLPLAPSVPCMDSTPPDVRCDTQIETFGERSFVTQHHDARSCAWRGQCQPVWPTRKGPACFGGASCRYFGAEATNEHWPDVMIPEGHFLAMGDNRDNSSDGRFWGLIEREDVLGKAMFIWWAGDKRRIFESIH
jgi:signal peptidase I